MYVCLCDKILHPNRNGTSTKAAISWYWKFLLRGSSNVRFLTSRMDILVRVCRYVCGLLWETTAAKGNCDFREGNETRSGFLVKINYLRSGFKFILVPRPPQKCVHAYGFEKCSSLAPMFSEYIYLVYLFTQTLDFSTENTGFHTISPYGGCDLVKFVLYDLSFKVHDWRLRPSCL